jgi:catechol 2,3-dioxygenase-like lactoylglutathione lyase family enzyme
MIGVKKIAHAVYEVPDIQAQTDYFTEILGLIPIFMGLD